MERTAPNIDIEKLFTITEKKLAALVSEFRAKIKAVKRDGLICIY